MELDGSLSCSSACVGKTVAWIDDSADNYMEIHFTDGTWIAWEVENMGHGFYAMVIP